jgi:hypothetical protein
MVDMRTYYQRVKGVKGAARNGTLKLKYVLFRVTTGLVTG